MANCLHEHIELREYLRGLWSLWICKDCGRPFRKSPHVRLQDDKYFKDNKKK